MKKTLKQRIIDLFDVYIPTGTSDDAAIKELDRRGKFSTRKMMDVLFLIVEEIELLREKDK